MLTVFIVNLLVIGTVVTLLLETDNGYELKIQKQQRELEQFDFHIETPFWVSWSPDSVYILP